MQTGDTNYSYKNELDKTCFQHDMAYGKNKGLEKRTQSKLLQLQTIQNMLDIGYMLDMLDVGYMRISLNGL